MSYKAYNAYADYVNVILHGNILAVRQHSLPYGGMSVIAVGYAATPFLCFVLLFRIVRVGFLHPRRTPPCKSSMLEYAESSYNLGFLLVICRADKKRALNLFFTPN